MQAITILLSAQQQAFQVQSLASDLPIRSNRIMTKASQEGHLLDFIAVALLSHGYNSVLNMPDEVDGSLTEALNGIGVITKLDKIRFGYHGTQFTWLIDDAPRKHRQYHTRWIKHEGQELPRCEYRSAASPKGLYARLAHEYGTQERAWEVAAANFIRLLRTEMYMPLVKPNETHADVRKRFPEDF